MTLESDVPPLVFIAEDDPDDLLLVQKALQLAQIQCELVRFLNGRALLDELLTGRCPDLVLLDLNMPVLSGDQVLIAVRQQNRLRDLPLVVLSTSSLSSDRDKAMGLGARMFLTKPASVRAYAELLADVFRGLPGGQGDMEKQ